MKMKADGERVVKTVMSSPFSAYPDVLRSVR
jgi:hypothetical protein